MKGFGGDFLKKDNLIIIILLGVLLMIIAIPNGTNKKDEPVISEGTYSDFEQAFDENLSEDELENLEEKFEKILMECNGVGEAKVMLTRNSETKLPGIDGVVVVAKGAGNATVSGNICDMAHALFGLEKDRIKVVKMVGNN